MDGPGLDGRGGCDLKRLSKPCWTISCGPRPPARSIAARSWPWKRPDRRRVGDAGKGSGGAAAGKPAEGVLEPLLPASCRRGRPWHWPLREVVNAIFYVLRCSCLWRLLPPVGLPPAMPVEPCRPPPKDLPPWRTAHRWFARLRDAGTWEALNFALVMADRERVGCSASLSAAVLDSQSVRTTEAGGLRGCDALHKGVSASPLCKGRTCLTERSFSETWGFAGFPTSPQGWIVHERATRDRFSPGTAPAGVSSLRSPAAGNGLLRRSGVQELSALRVTSGRRR